MANRNWKAKMDRTSDRRQPTIAFGGNKQRNDDRNINIQSNRFNERNVNIQNNRRITQYNRNDYRYYRPPTTVFRNWDRRHVHSWNSHNYRWYNNDWVIIDAGISTPYYYDYDSMPAPIAEYGVSDNTALAVQQELSRRGYDPGVIDGVIGPQTRNAIAAYQEDHGLAATGRIDRSLLREMDL